MTNDPIVHWDQSSWQAKRAVDAAAIGPPTPPPHVALPGAKQAVAHDRLLAYQEAGMGEHEIVERVNGRCAEENSERITQHQRWVAGPYSGAIEELRKRAAQAAAEELRRKAAFERLLAEHEE